MGDFRGITICKKMKYIVFIETQKYPDVIGGAEVFDYYLVNKLSELCNVAYLSHSSWDKSTVPFYPIKKIKPPAIISPLLIFFKVLKNKKDIGLIHFRYSRSKFMHYWPYILLKKLFGVEYIITIHGGGLTPWYFKFFYKYLFRNAYKTFGVSDRICDEYEKRVNIQIKNISALIPFEDSENNIEEIKSIYGISENSKIFLVVGSLKPSKNPITVIEAFCILGKKYIEENNIRLIFVGDGPQKMEMAKKINDNGLEKYVTLTGNISRKIIPDYYKIAFCYVISSNFESFGISMVEAMYNKLPIIAADAPGINTTINDKENGLLYKKRDANSLSQAIKLILKDENIRECIAKNAKETYKEKFDYNIVLNQYKELIDR